MTNLEKAGGHLRVLTCEHPVKTFLQLQKWPHCTDIWEVICLHFKEQLIIHEWDWANETMTKVDLRSEQRSLCRDPNGIQKTWKKRVACATNQ